MARQRTIPSCIAVPLAASDPSGIVANSLRPDFAGDEEDTFEVLLDTFADSRGAFLFVTNPRGARRDVQISSGGDVHNVDWAAVWDVAVRTTAEGWFVETRPSSMRSSSTTARTAPSPPRCGSTSSIAR